MRKMAQNETSQEPKKPGQYNSFLRYSGFAFQLFATTGVMGWLGYKLDQYLGIGFPLFMTLFGMTAFGWIIYRSYRSLNKD